MGARYTNTKIISSKPTKLQRRFKLILYVGAACMAIAATLTIVAFIRAEKDSSDSLPQSPYGTLDELTELEVFIPAYLSGNCPADLLKSTQTIRVSGQIESGANSQAFTLLRKRPDRMLFTIGLDPHAMTVGVSGDTVWRRIRAPGQDDQYGLIKGDEAKEWLERRRFFDRIISTTLGDGSITAIKTARWDAKDCLEITTQDAISAPVTTLVDPQTMYPIAELQTLSDSTIQQTVFSDYRDIRDMPIPFRMESFVGNKLESRIILDQASINSGVLSKLFDVPDSLLAESNGERQNQPNTSRNASTTSLDASSCTQ